MAWSDERKRRWSERLKEMYLDHSRVPTAKQMAALTMGCKAERRPHHKPHSDKTRALIGLKSKARWARMSPEEKRAELATTHAAALKSEPKRAPKRRAGIAKQWASMMPEQRSLRTRPWRAACYRANPSSLERTVGALLEALGIEFVPQYPIGRYVVDFLVPDKKLVIECDGSFWHSRPGVPEKDAARDAYLGTQGYRVLRLPQVDIEAGRARDVLLRVVGGISERDGTEEL